MKYISSFAVLTVFVVLSISQALRTQKRSFEDHRSLDVDLSEVDLIDRYKQNLFSTEFPDLILDLPSEEISALHDFYLSTNGDLWTKPKYNASGIEWSFSDISQSNPCFDNWVGISCVCNVNASEFHWFSYAMYGDYYYQPNAPPDAPKRGHQMLWSSVSTAVAEPLEMAPASL